MPRSCKSASLTPERLRWRAEDERPQTGIETALIAAVDPAVGETFLYGIFLWRGDHWESEDTGQPLRERPFWWIPEDDLLAEVPRC
jgi:hypothetical protein